MIKCPACDSTKVKKYALVHLQSSSTSEGRTIGIGVSGVMRPRLGMGIAHHSREQSSLLAQHCAPPEAKKVFSGAVFFLSFVVAIFLAVPFRGTLMEPFLFWGSLLVINGIQAVNARRYNNGSFLAEHKAWDSSFMCMVCGQQFTRHAQ